MNGVVGHSQEPEEEVSGYGQHQPTPGRRERHFSLLPVEIVYNPCVHLPCGAALCFSLPTRGYPQSAFVPVLCRDVGA